MPEKVLIITPKDIGEDGIINYDFTGWDGNIVLPPSKLCIINQPLKCGTIHSESDLTVFNKSVSCFFFKTKNTHARGNLVTYSNLLSEDIIIDGDCNINGDCIVNNISTIGHISINGNLKCSKKAMFMGRSYINGKDNTVWNIKLHPKFPMVFFDQCSSKDAYSKGELIVPDRICIAFGKDGEEMIFVGGSKSPMKLNRFGAEFSAGYPGLVKYIEEIKIDLKSGQI